ncbi:hypothetical protein QTO34_009760 [Cnephaeus nilssonii]|uniref:Alpha-1B-glycoprotein n=1 Tax=Cnephaeus nilssonii TaxID=3371016 RepID=A0AA40LFE5_CNENI|nr:hypothetical protein QTO34_009760 [Eptesicus nilssonii]
MLGHGDGWTSLSNLLEMTGAAGLRGVTFLLRREGDAQFLELAKAPQAVEAAFPVHRAGNYSCSYRTHEAGPPSEPSATVTIEEMGEPGGHPEGFLGEATPGGQSCLYLDPPDPECPCPRLGLGHSQAAAAQAEREGESGEPAAVLSVGAQVSLGCVAPVEGVEFQLRHGDQELRVHSWSTTPGRVFFELKSLKPADSGPLHLPLPAERGGHGLVLGQRPGGAAAERWHAAGARALGGVRDPEPRPGALVTLRCRAPLAGQRFALLREDARGRRPVRGLQSPAGPEARFELRDVSPMDSSNYSCVYVGPAPPAGSAPSARLELRLDGPLPKPRLRPLWSGKVIPGRDAALRCETPVAHESLELLGAGEVVASTYGPSEDLVLTYVGPQHSASTAAATAPGGPWCLS